MPVNPGRLRNRITIQSITRVQTPGGWTEAWADSTNVWANLSQPSPSGTARYAQAGYSLVTHEVTLRAGPSIQLGKSRFKLGDRTFEPTAPVRDADQTGRFILVPCRELNNGET